jgi:hypothetical protein
MDVTPLKRFAIEHLREYLLTKELVLSEPDSPTDEEFVTKSMVWLHLLRAEVRSKRPG